MNEMLDDEEEHLHSKLRTKGKCQTYLLRPDILELKPRTRRQGKCLGAALEVLQNEELLCADMENSEKPTDFLYISNDIWFHLADYIRPEDVKRYAMTCTQSANSIKSRRFWLQLYRKYCQHSGDRNKRILALPTQLQMHQLVDCDIQTLRQRVIQALFYCHPPFTKRLKDSYKLDTLVGRTYMSSWHTQVQCVWIMCYKFRQNFPIINNIKQASLEQDGESDEMDVTNDWETLVDECNNNQRVESNQIKFGCTSSSLDIGVSLLVIRCDRFIPFPSDFLCANCSSSIRLMAIRKLLCTDMRSINLEIDLASLTGDQKITWKYQRIQKLKVLPWWHPDFKELNKCQLSSFDNFEIDFTT